VDWDVDLLSIWASCEAHKVDRSNVPPERNSKQVKEIKESSATTLVSLLVLQAIKKSDAMIWAHRLVFKKFSNFDKGLPVAKEGRGLYEGAIFQRQR
jgi:hypothetical protein